MSCHILVAAIDFGTTFSSWGFSFKHEFDLEPTKITAKQWTGLQSAVSLKGPTTILIKPDGETIDSFGFDAETRYAELAEDREHKDWYFFKRFKMQLFNKIGLSRNFTIEDATGKPLQAKTVDSVCLYAGLKTENVTIALEPESASLYCQHIPATKSHNSLGKLPAGSKYLILDVGGGTVDVTAHQIMPDGILKEIKQATGGDWGGTKVDQAFENFLSEITGEGVMDSFKNKAMEDYLDLMRCFEVKKREIKATSERQVSLKIPVALIDQTKEHTGITVREKIQKTKYKDQLDLAGDKIRLDADIMKGFFTESLENIVNHLEDLFRLPQLKECQAILMVGGYSESSILQERIRACFREKNVIIPADAGLAVLKGAVIFGHNPSLIAERICRFTYGTAITHKKKSTCTHRKTTTFIAEEEERCMNIFDAHVSAGDIVKVGEWQEEKLYTPIHKTQTSLLFSIYCTKDRSPELVTDSGCVKLGEVRLLMPDTTGGVDREAFASFRFGGTELEVKVNDKSAGTERKISLSFLG
ncbi:heat shock 70 kDa protein 12A-like [Ruditapes philippinarum]|uniref:heat shock 70 kDa protein 12A-like n=1 Tax=Ruditapes philippinarum TaxID=129788 RepID=UPI00295BB87F|nr:heat shock 70 kDa protein 12A-like [Ruditapes philippinarum]